MSILASQTDSNSPVSQDLMDALRLALGFLGCKTYSAVSDGTGGTWIEVTLDDVIDWRRRFIVPIGRGATFANSAAAVPFIVGGATESQIGDQYHVPAVSSVNGFDFSMRNDTDNDTGGMTRQILPRKIPWMFTANGCAAYNSNPSIIAYNCPGGTPTVCAYMWVSTSGSLKITWKKVGSSDDFAALNFIVIYSNQL